jgi:Helix-turn-helix domain
MYQTQTSKVIEYLKKHPFITSRIAIDKLYITRLASRINDCKNAGFEFDTSERNEHNFVMYRLIK